jgi:uncharacterized metal-binding protein YceD (DUF177 family)
MSHTKNRSSQATERARARREAQMAADRDPTSTLLTTASDGKPSIVVELDDVPESGFHLKEVVPQGSMSALFGVKPQDVLAPSASSDATLDLTLRDEGVGIFRLRGKLVVEVTHPCVRCLENVRFPLALDLDLRLHEGRAELTPDDKVDLAAGGTAALREADDEDIDALAVVDDDEDFVTFEGGRVDVMAVAREQLLLALPMHPSCESEGAVTEGPCRFDTLKEMAEAHGAEGDPRFAGLKDWAKNRALKNIH